MLKLYRRVWLSEYGYCFLVLYYRSDGSKSATHLFKFSRINAANFGRCDLVKSSDGFNVTNLNLCAKQFANDAIRRNPNSLSLKIDSEPFLNVTHQSEPMNRGIDSYFLASPPCHLTNILSFLVVILHKKSSYFHSHLFNIDAYYYNIHTHTNIHTHRSVAQFGF